MNLEHSLHSNSGMSRLSMVYGIGLINQWNSLETLADDSIDKLIIMNFVY